MEPNTRLVLRLAVSGYLIYLAWQIGADQLAGKSAMADWLAYGAAAVMAVSAAAFAVYSLARWRRDRAEAEEEPGEEKVNDQD